MTRSKLIVGLIAATLTLVGCVGVNQPPEEGERTTIYNGWIAVSRIVDTEAGIVCWVSSGSGTGIDCMPIAETTLD
jgi:uncharacterized lipoprotein NlpE involved in copper resistance